MLQSINLVCLPNQTSYGLCATNIIKELDKLGVRVSLFPIIQFCQRCGNSGIEADPEDHELLKKCLSNAQFFDSDAPSVRVWHQFSLDMYPGRGKKWGFPIFELDKFNPLELHHLKAQNGLVVTSKWARDILIKNGIYDIPIKVVPLGVDNSIFHSNYHESYSKRISSTSTAFYMIGKKEIRKGLDFIGKCFDKAFNQSDDVELHMFYANRILKNSYPKEDANWDNYYQRLKLSNKVKTYDWLPSQRDLAAQICNLDCGLFVSRAEGFDLGLLESMAMARQVIVTDCTAHTEFASKENSYLIDMDDMEVAHDGIWFHGQGNWYNFGSRQEEQLINYMRQVHSKKQSGDNLYNAAGKITAEKLTWTNTAQELIKALS